MRCLFNAPLLAVYHPGRMLDIGLGHRTTAPFKKAIMSGEKDLTTLLKNMKPDLHPGEYVFCTVKELGVLPLGEIVLLFREQEGMTIVLSKDLADRFGLTYSFVAGWITLTVHSSLEAIGLTAAFSKALSEEGISCNVVAAFYHDHVFVNTTDCEKAMEVLRRF